LKETSHGLRLGIIWVIATAIIEAYFIVFNPPLQPRSSIEGFGEARTMELFFYVGTPIFVFVVVFMLYAVFTFRRRRGESLEAEADVEPPYARSNGRATFYWSLISISTVVFLAGFGIFSLNDVSAAPEGRPFTVQVIAQQWHFTYRYPDYGGVESLDLAVPVGRSVTFNITSLDVVHDFWIYDLDVKQNAVPGQTTHAYMLAPKVGNHWIVCDELCGIWHGYMRGPMYVLSESNFTTWIHRQQQISKALHGRLPTIHGVYYPDTPSAYPAAPQSSAQ